MTDPRAENCRGYAEENGKTTGVRLEYLPAPETTYELIRATLVDEVAAQGNIVATVQVLDKDNIAARVNCYLAWPWRGWQPLPRTIRQIATSTGHCFLAWSPTTL